MGYQNKYKDYYGNAPLADIAKDAYKRGYHNGEPDYETWEKSSGVNKLIQEDAEKRRPKTFTDKIRDAVASVTPKGFEDIPTSFLHGATLGYVPETKTPEDAGMGHKVAKGVAELAGMGVGLIPAAAILPESATLAGAAGTSALLGGIYGAVRKPEEGETRLNNIWKDALMFGTFGVGGKAIASGLGRLMPESVGAVLDKITENAKLPVAERLPFDKLLTSEEQAIHNRLQYVTSATLGGGAGATEPAKDFNERLQNILIGAGTFAGAHGVTSAFGKLKERKKTEDPEAEKFIDTMQSAVEANDTIAEHVRTGNVDEALNLIKDFKSKGIYDENDIDRLKDQHPQLRDGLNDVIADDLMEQVRAQVTEPRPDSISELKNDMEASKARRQEADVPDFEPEEIPRENQVEIDKLKSSVAEQEKYLAKNAGYKGTDIYKKWEDSYIKDRAKLSELTGEPEIRKPEETKEETAPSDVSGQQEIVQPGQSSQEAAGIKAIPGLEPVKSKAQNMETRIIELGGIKHSRVIESYISNDAKIFDAKTKDGEKTYRQIQKELDKEYDDKGYLPDIDPYSNRHPIGYPYIGDSAPELIEKLKERGYDGAYFDEGNGRKSTAVWNEDKIKTSLPNPSSTPEEGVQYTRMGKTFDDYKEKIEKTSDYKSVKTASDAFGNIYEGMKRAFYPAALSKDAKKVSEVLIEQMGKNWHQSEKLKGDLNKIVAEHSQSTSVTAKALDAMQTSTGVLADVLFNKMPKEAQWSFISRIQKGEHQNTKELQNVADTMTKMFNDLWSEADKVMPGQTAYRKNYFPGIWEEKSVKAFNQAFKEAQDKEIDISDKDGKAWLKNRTQELYKQGKGMEGDAISEYLLTTKQRSMEGSKAFQKQKVFDNIYEGIEAGLIPKGTPIDMAFEKMHEVQKYINTHRTLQQLEPGKTAITIKSGDKTPAGYTLISEPYGIFTKRVTAGKYTEGGGEEFKEIAYRYAVKNEVAQVFNNYLSKSLYDSPYVGQAWKAYMGAANGLNQFQLGVGSAFHAGFMSAESVITHFALGVKALSRGEVGRAAKMFAESPLYVYRQPMIGDKLLKAYRGDNVPMTDEISRQAQWLEMAGARAKMDNRLRTTSTDKMLADWTEGNKFKAAIRTPFAMVEQLSRPVMEWLVPRSKFGAFAEMANEWYRQNPNATHEDTRSAMQYIWNRIDSRMGQVVYERMLVNNVAKNVVQALMRAPGWTGGTIVEVGGGLNDFANVFRDISNGKKPVMTDKMAYTISLLTVTGLINGVMTKLLTGEDPKDGKDLLAFRTGKIDEHGNPERMLLPTYAKDIYAYINKPGQTLLNKTHPIISLMSDIAKNKDYYGVQIRDKEENMPTQAVQTGEYALKAFVPFWMRGAQKAHERGDDMATMISPLVGIMPATSEFTKTKAQLAMSEILQDRPKGTQTREQAERNQLKNKIETRLRNDDKTAQADMEQYLKEGKLSRSDVISIRKAVRTPYEVHAYKMLSLKEAMRVYSLGTPEEKKKFYPILRQKLSSIRNLPEEERKEIVPKVKEIIGNNA